MDELSTKCDVPDETIMELALSYSKNKASSIIPGWDPPSTMDTAYSDLWMPLQL